MHVAAGKEGHLLSHQLKKMSPKILRQKLKIIKGSENNCCAFNGTTLSTMFFHPANPRGIT